MQGTRYDRWWPWSIICPLWVHLHNTQTSTVNIYQLTPFKINGAISRMLLWNRLFPVSLTQSLQPSSSFFLVPVKILLSCLPSLVEGNAMLASRILLASPLPFQCPVHWTGCSLQWATIFLPFRAFCLPAFFQEHWKSSPAYGCFKVLF